MAQLALPYNSVVDLPTSTILGNLTGSTADAAALTKSQLWAWLLADMVTVEPEAPNLPWNDSGVLSISTGIYPVITVQPASQSGSFGGTAEFSVTATGTGLTYQWQANDGGGWDDMPGETSASLAISPLTVELDGYQYRCVVTNVYNLSTTSDAATLTVTSVIYTVALIGDSITNQNGTVNTQDQGYFTWANSLSGNRFPTYSNSYNKAISGRTLSTIDTQKVTDLGSLSPAPTMVVFLGGANDITAATTEASMIASINSIVSYITSTLGAICILQTIMPRDASAGVAISGAQLTKLQNVNTYIRSLAALNVKIVDSYSALASSDRPIQTLFWDTFLHPGAAGAIAAGKVLRDVISANYGVFSEANLPGTELFSNPTMSGTGGVAFQNLPGGVVATGWRMQCSVASGTASKNVDGSQAITFARSGEGVLDNFTAEFSSVVSSGFVAGTDSVVGWMRLGINALSKCRGIELRVQTQTGATINESVIGNKSLITSSPNYIYVDDAAGETLLIQTPALLIQSGRDGLQVRLTCYFHSAASGGASADFNIFGGGVRKL